MEVSTKRMRRVVVCDKQFQIMDLFLCNFVGFTRKTT